MLLLLARHGSLAAGIETRARAAGVSVRASAPPPAEEDGVDSMLLLADAHAVFPAAEGARRGVASAADLRALLARYQCDEAGDDHWLACGWQGHTRVPVAAFLSSAGRGLERRTRSLG